MNLHFKSIVLSIFLCLILSGCSSGMEQVFLVKNKSGVPSDISDCFVKILLPTGNKARELNTKKVIFLFRDAKSDVIFRREITFLAPAIKPSIDWSGFPIVKVSLIGEDQRLRILYSVDVNEERAVRGP